MADLDRAIAALRDWNSRRGQISGSLASLRKHDAEGAKHARTILAALDAARGEAVAVVNRHMLETLVPNRWIPVVAPSEERSDTDVLLFAAPPAAPRVERYGDGVLVHWPEGMEQYVCVGDCVTGKLAAPPAALAVPDCGCCKGDGSMCPTVCRHAEENPPIFDRLPENEAEAEAMGLSNKENTND